METQMATRSIFAGLLVVLGVTRSVDGLIKCTGAIFTTYCHEQTQECVDGSCQIVKTTCSGFTCRIKHGVCCPHACCPSSHTCCGGACCPEKCCGSTCVAWEERCPTDTTTATTLSPTIRTAAPETESSSGVIYIPVILMCALIPGCVCLWIALRRCYHPRPVDRLGRPGHFSLGPTTVNAPDHIPPSSEQNQTSVPNIKNPYSATFNRMYGPDAYIYIPPPDPPASTSTGHPQAYTSPLPAADPDSPPPAYSTLFSENHAPDVTSNAISTNSSRGITSDIPLEETELGMDYSADSNEVR